MSEKHERLRQARTDAGFRFASDAANAIGVTASTYRAHENGQNDFGLDEAKRYARKFGVNPLWLLGEDSNGIVIADTQTGTNVLPGPSQPNAIIQGKVEGEGTRIPVYGQAVGGVDGEFLMVVSRMWWKLASSALRACNVCSGQAARSRDIGTRG